jgi:hypothetical protein
LVSGKRIFHAGFLPIEISDQWNDLLYPLRRRALYLSVPAAVGGETRPFTEQVDLGGALDAVGIANSQSVPR